MALIVPSCLFLLWLSFTSSDLLSVLFSGASLECIHKVEGSQVLAQKDALLHREDAGDRHMAGGLVLYKFRRTWLEF